MNYKYTPTTTSELKSAIFDIILNYEKKFKPSNLKLEIHKKLKENLYNNINTDLADFIDLFFDDFTFNDGSQENIYSIIYQYNINNSNKLKDLIKINFFSKFHKTFYDFYFNLFYNNYNNDNLDYENNLKEILNLEKERNIDDNFIEQLLDYYISIISPILLEKKIFIDFNVIDISKIQKFSNIFESLNKFKENLFHYFPGIEIQFDISEWNLSNAIDLSEMFKNIIFNGDISKWNVSNVVTMAGMFKNSSFNGDISMWDISNVKNMSGMFANSIFNGNISNWDVSNVENMAEMFKGTIFNNDISKWNVSNVTNMSLMFYNSLFDNDISMWDVSNVKNMSGMFAESSFNGDISKWNMKNVENIDEMFFRSKFKRDLSLWELDSLITMDNAFAWTKIYFDISLWYIPNLKEDRTKLKYLYEYKFDVSEFDKYTKRKAKAKEYKVLSLLSEDEINKFGGLADNLVYIKYLGYGYFVFDYYNEKDKEDIHSKLKQGIYNYYTNEVILVPKYEYIGDIDQNLNANIIIGRNKYKWNGDLVLYYGVFNLNKKETVTRIKYEDIEDVENIRLNLEYELINNIKIKDSNIDLDYVFNNIKDWENLTEEIKIGKEESEQNLIEFNKIKEEIAKLEEKLVKIKEIEEIKFKVLDGKIKKQKELEKELKEKYNLNIVDALNLIKQAKDNDFDEE